MLVELVQESIAEREKVKAAIEAELETLREIEGLAEKLNGGGTVSESVAAPMRPRQHDATRAEQRAAKKKTSTRRAPATSVASGASQRQASAGGDQVSGLPKGNVQLEILKLLGLRGEIAQAEVAEALGRHEVTVGNALSALERAGKVQRRREGNRKFVQLAGAGEDPGGSAPTPPTPEPDADAPQLVDRIVTALELDGGRMPRLDLRARMGDPDFDEFNSAIAILTSEGKISATRAGGVAAYELIGGAR